MGGRCYRGPRSLRKAEGRERAARSLFTSPQPEGTGVSLQVRSVGGHEASLRSRAGSSAPFPSRRVGAALLARLRGGAWLRGTPAPGPRRGELQALSVRAAALAAVQRALPG